MWRDYKWNYKCLPYPKIKLGQKIFSHFLRKEVGRLGGSWTHC